MADETVAVALKHPHGLILRLYKMVMAIEPVMGGGTREIKRAEPIPGEVRLKGYAERGAKIALPASAGRFAITYNVPKKFWDDWIAQNQDHDFVTAGLIFAGSANYVSGRVREYEKLKCGLEPLDPDNLPIAGISSYEKDAA